MGELLSFLMAMIASAWAFGAIWFDAPFGSANKIVAGVLAIGCAITLAVVRPFWLKIAAVALLFGAVLAWWLTLSPTNDGDWRPEMG